MNTEIWIFFYITTYGLDLEIQLQHSGTFLYYILTRVHRWLKQNP